MAALVFLAFAAPALGVACGNSTMAWSFDSTNHTNQTLVVDNITRSFYVHVPSSYDPNTSHPVVLSYHGYDETEQGQELVSGLSDDSLVINNTGIIAVYPAGSWGPGKTSGTGWYRSFQGAPYSTPGIDDLAYTQSVVASLQENLCVDSNRIYATGKSNGAGLINLLMCSNTTNALFAAFAPISAALYPTSLPDEGCDPGRPIPFINFHGLNDTIIPMAGRASNAAGNTAYALPNITVWRQNWAARNGCPAQTINNVTSFATQSENNTGYAWDCGFVSAFAVINAYTVYDLEHSWPSTLPYDNGSTVHDPDPEFPIWEAIASFNATPTYIVPFLGQFSLDM